MGIILQNPDHQIIGPTVEDDIAFGLENLGVEREAMRDTVERVMDELELEPLRAREPHFLSAGQKQKLALAGVLAMQPGAIVSDESTSLLDPASRAEVLSRLRALNRDRGVTLVHITHRLEEALTADRVLVLKAGGAVLMLLRRNCCGPADCCENWGWRFRPWPSSCHSCASGASSCRK